MIGWGDIFDFNDDKEVQKAVQGFEKISKVYEDFIKGTTTLKAQYEKNLDSMAQSAKQFEKAVNDINPATEKGRTQLAQMSKQAEVSGAQYDKMKAKIEQLEASLKKVTEESKKFNDSKKKTVKTNDQLARLEDKLASLNTDQAKKIAQTRIEIQKKNRELKNAARETSQITSLYEKESARLIRLRSDYKKVALQEGLNSKSAKELRVEVNKLDKQLKKVDKSVGQNQRNVGNYESAFDSLGVNLKQFASPAGLAVGAVAGVGLAMNELRKEINATLKNMKETENLTGLTGLALQQLTADVKTTADVFGKEYNEVLTTANAVTNAFGTTHAETMDLINEGLVRGFDINGEYLDQLKEYGVFFEEAGLSARDLIEVIGTSTQQGIFSDKGVDAIKEASLRIREMTPATRDAIDAIGLSSDAITKGLEDGTKSVFDVIQEVSGAMSELPPQSAKVGTAIADIFGGAGEDAGLKFLLTLKDIKTTQEGVNSSLTDYQKNQLEVLRVTEEYNGELVALSTNFKGFTGQFDLFVANVKNTALSVLNDLLQNFTSLDNQVAQFKKTVSQTKDLGALQKELEKINTEIEENKDEGFTWMDGLNTALFGTAYAAGKAGEEVASLYAKKKLLEDQIQSVTEEQNKNTVSTSQNITATQTATQAEVKRMAGLERLLSYQDLQKKKLDEVKQLYEVVYGETLAESEQNQQQAHQGFLDRMSAEINAISDRYKKERSEAQQTADLIAQYEADKEQNYIDAAYAGVDAINGLFARQTQAIEEEIAMNQQKMESELELAKENEEGQEMIRQRAQEEEERLMDEMAKKRRQQAIFNKSVAIAEIGINTALGIMKTIGQLGLPAALPFVIATGVLGAAQIGAVLAQPIPAYEQGTDFAEGGTSIVGEAGRELILRPDGRVEVSGDSAEVRDVPRGSKVIPADETEKILSQSKKQGETAVSIDNGIRKEKSELISPDVKQFLARENDSIIEGFNRAVSQLEIHNLYFEDGDLKRSIRKGNTTLKNVQKKYSFKR